MEFSDDALRLAFIRCRGFCECTIEEHGHLLARCHNRVEWEKRGRKDEGGWKAKAVDPDQLGGAGDPDNCLILCRECYRDIR